MESTPTNSCNVCTHVTVESDGYNVCIKCGIVQDDLVFNNTFETIHDCENVSLQSNFLEKFNQIEELEARGVISNAILIDTKHYIKKWYSEKIPLQKFHHAYAVYFASRKQNFPLTLKEVSYFLQLSVKDICKIEKFVDHDFNDSPYDFISKFCCQLNLTYMDEKIIKSFLNENYKTSDRNPSHIAAAAISLSFPNIEKKMLSNVTWIASSTIKKIAREMRSGQFK